MIAALFVGFAAGLLVSNIRADLRRWSLKK